MRNKWIIAGILIIGIFFLLRDGLLDTIGINVAAHAKANFFLFLTIAGFVVVFWLVEPDSRKGLKWLPIISLLVFLLMGVGSCTKKIKSKSSSKTTFTSSVDIERITPSSDIKKASWGYAVNYRACEYQGLKVLQTKKDRVVAVKWIKGGKISNPEGKDHYDPYGYDEYADKYKDRFKFSWAQGVKPHSVLIIVKKPEDGLDSLNRDNILRFRKEEMQIKFRMKAGEELLLYYHDIDGEYFFRKNGRNGFMRFEIYL